MIDLNLIAEKLEFDIEDVEMLLNMFIDDALLSLALADKAIETEDFEQMKNIAHGIKGSASNLMIEDITQSAYEIEQLAKDKKSADYKTLFGTLKNQIELLEGIEA
jgi:HPt (histidine-containing phosphotransfer) domain-containing protein